MLYTKNPPSKEDFIIGGPMRNFVIVIIDVFIGILISFTFVMIYLFSDYSELNISPIVIQIIYLGLFQAIAFVFIVRGIIYFFKKDNIE